MPARLRLANHLRPEELFARYRRAKEPVERTHFQVLHLVSERWRTEEIAQAVSYSMVWIRVLVGRYNEGGVEAMGDRRRHNAGQARLLDEQGEARLRAALQKPPAD